MWSKICHVETFLHMINVETIFFVTIHADLSQNLLCCHLRCIGAKSILSRFTHFCVEKNLFRNCACGEKRTNIRYENLLCFLYIIPNFWFLEEKFAASCILLSSFSFWGKLLMVNLEISLESDPGWAVDADLSNAGQMFCHALVKFNHDRNRNWILSTTSIAR